MPGGLTRRRFVQASAGAAVTAALDPAAFARTPDGPNVVLFIVDTLRADAVFDERARTPNMDAPAPPRAQLRERLPRGHADRPGAQLDHGRPA